MILVGGGIGGLAAALALARRGVASTVLERAERFGEVGAGVQISPNAARVLFALGLEVELRRVGFQPDAAAVRDAASGRTLLCNPLGDAATLRWGAPYLTVHRADLHAILAKAVAETGLATLRLGARAAALEPGGVRLQTGEGVEGDVVVGCDGVRSEVRSALFGEDALRFTGQVAWRLTAPADGVREARVWTGPSRHFVCYPVRGGDLMNVVAVTEEDWRVESWSEPGDKAALLAAFAGWPEAALSLIRSGEGVHRWALYDRPPLACWSKGRASLLGDAAHPMLPFLAQGAAMAIEDAAVLARALTAGDAPEAALRRYEAARRPRTAKIQAWSRRNARLFHLPSAMAQGVFGGAALIDRLTPGGSAARFDWLYGYDALNAPI